MALYSYSTTGATTASIAIWGILPPSNESTRIHELHVTQTTAVITSFGFGRASAAGVTPTSPVAVIAETYGDAAGRSTVATAWATPPTAPAAYLRRIYLPATTGQGVILVFPYGISMQPAFEMTLTNLIAGASAVANITAVVSE